MAEERRFSGSAARLTTSAKDAISERSKGVSSPLRRLRAPLKIACDLTMDRICLR